MIYVSTCYSCGKEFTQTNSRNKYCSEECKKVLEITQVDTFPFIFVFSNPGWDQVVGVIITAYSTIDAIEFIKNNYEPKVTISDMKLIGVSNSPNIEVIEEFWSY